MYKTLTTLLYYLYIYICVSTLFLWLSFMYILLNDDLDF